VKKNAPVEIAQLPQEIRPLGTRSASAEIPAPQKSLPASEAKPASPAQEIKPDDRLTARADELFRKGDVSGARLLLEHSLKSGNARAAFLLAETFDPHVLAKLGVMGIRGDAAKAREFYAQAQALGMTQASARIEALK
jgi:TPR repeat protein